MAWLWICGYAGVMGLAGLFIFSNYRQSTTICVTCGKDYTTGEHDGFNGYGVDKNLVCHGPIRHRVASKTQ